MTDLTKEEVDGFLHNPEMPPEAAENIKAKISSLLDEFNKLKQQHKLLTESYQELRESYNQLYEKFTVVNEKAGKFDQLTKNFKLPPGYEKS